MKNTFTTLFICLLTTVAALAQTNRDSIGNYNSYGGKVGVGISIFDGFGIPVRFYLSPKNVLEAGFYFGAIAVITDDQLEILAGPLVGVGYTYFGNRFEKPKYQKIRANGVAVRFNHLAGDYSTSMLSLGWAMETIRKKHPQRSFILELGLKQTFPDFVYNGEAIKATTGIYLRCHWNLFL